MPYGFYFEVIHIFTKGKSFYNNQVTGNCIHNSVRYVYSASRISLEIALKFINASVLNYARFEFQNTNYTRKWTRF